jgi:hypothetical protein
MFVDLIADKLLVDKMPVDEMSAVKMTSRHPPFVFKTFSPLVGQSWETFFCLKHTFE